MEVFWGKMRSIDRLFRQSDEVNKISAYWSVFLLRHFDYAQCDATLRTSPGGKDLRGFGTSAGSAHRISLAGNTCDKRRYFYRWLRLSKPYPICVYQRSFPPGKYRPQGVHRRSFPYWIGILLRKDLRKIPSQNVYLSICE